jgi:nucleotide-binding universal stress UspA family protein
VERRPKALRESMYRRILVPLDGSRVAESVLPHVQELARHLKARLILLRVLDPVPYTVTSVIKEVRREDMEHERSQAEIYLSARQKDLADRGVESSTIVLHGPPVQAIIETASAEDVDLIAMGSHGRGFLSGVFYGSVASALLHRVQRPLLLIRSEAEDS